MVSLAGPSKLAGLSTRISFVSGGENAPINGDGEFFGEVSLSSSPFCVEGAVVLVAVKDASRRCAVAFGHP